MNKIKIKKNTFCIKCRVDLQKVVSKLQFFASQQMYAINIAPQNSQKCQSCQNTFIQYIGTQAWCLDCKKAIKTIQQEIKVVPKMYQSNCKDKQSSAEIKIKNYLNEFCNKYGGVSDNQEMNWMYHQAIELKNKKGMTTKNYRENCASVVYVYFKDIHRLSIKEFCKKNQIDQKSFNKSYLIYQKVLKEKRQSQNSLRNFTTQSQLKKQGSDEELKFQYTNEQQSDQQPGRDDFRVSMPDFSSPNPRAMHYRELNLRENKETKFEQDEPARFQHLQEPQKNAPLERIRQDNLSLILQSRSFIQVVFDSFFTSLFYKEKRSLLVKELAENVVETYSNFKQILQTCEPFQFISLQCSINNSNFYKYFLYIVLRKLSNRISQLKYRKIIQDTTGELIKITLLKQIIKLFDQKQETVSFSGDSMFFIENQGTTGSQVVKIEEKE